jgi:hypothetical protein
MADQKDPEVNQIIDRKLPLPWLISSAASIVFALLAMYFKLDQLGTDVVELKATVRASGATSSTVQNEVAILRFRIETLEKKEHAKP